MEYRLRRIGQLATVSNVLDIMNLCGEVTKFGRNPYTNDYFLDSGITKCLISRNHAEIHCVTPGITSGAQFVIRGLGMNGTYVNDIRLDSQQVLKEGDKVTFGHKNGINIKPGQLAKQPRSEFCFVFERVKDRTKHNVTQEVDDTPAYAGSIDIDTVNSSQHSADENLSELSLTALNLCYAQTSDTNNDKTLAATNTNIQSDVLRGDSPNSFRNSRLETTVGAFSSTPTSSCDRQSSVVGSNHETDTPILSNKFMIADCKVLFPNTSTINDLTPFDKEIMEEVSRVSCHFSSDDEAASSGRLSPLIPNFTPLTLPFSSPKPVTSRQSKRERAKPAKFNNENVPPTKRRKDTQLSSVAAAETKPKVITVQETKPKAGKRKSTKGRRAVEVYRRDSCFSIDCCKPQKEPIDWVQCDDCDKWYHMLCAGCSLKDVEKSKTQFHCGC